MQGKSDTLFQKRNKRNVKRARDMAEILGCPIAIIDKRRLRANEAEAMNLIGSVEDKNVIIIDDMVDTAGTIVSGVKMLKENGAKDIYVAIGHPVLSGPAIERIENADIKKFVCTDTIELPKEKQIDKIEVVSVSNMLADIIKGQVLGNSIHDILLKYRKRDFIDK